MVILDLTDQGDCNYSTLLILLYPGYGIEDMQTEKRPQILAKNKIQQQIQQNPRGPILLTGKNCFQCFSISSRMENIAN